MKVLDLEGLGYFWTKIKNKFYIKPDTGIPKSDLSSEVQGSLNKADTALQTETDPIFTASPAHGISSEDIIRWNNLESLGISTLSLSIDSSTYVLTLSGTKVDGTSFVVPNPIDLPLESVVVSGSYDSVNKKVILTLKDGSTIEFSIADLISGLQEEITPSNKLSADLIEDGVTNKVVTQSEKTIWNNKSDFSGSYNDLTDKPHIPNDQIQSDWNQSDSTQVDYIKNKPTNVSSFNNDAGYLTEHQSLSNYYTKSETDDLLDDKADISDLATVATSGDYNDLTNKPTIPSAQVNSDWNATSGVAQILNKPDIPSVSQVNNTGTSITVGSTSYNIVTTNSPSGNANTYTAPSWSAMDNVYSELDFRTHVDDTSIGVNTDDELYVKSLSADKLTNGTNNKVFTASEQTKLAGIAAGAEVNVQSDWNETNTSNDAFIKNKPTIPDDSNLVHKTGDETIYQKKTFAANGEIHLASSWNQIYNDDDDESLQAALNARNNVQADWNQTTTTAADYIKNKPDITVDSNNDMTINGHIITIEGNDIGLYSDSIYLDAIGNSINFNAGVENDQLKIYGDEGVFIEGANNKNIKLTTSGNGKAYYNNNEIATKNDIPTNVSALTNDAGYLTSETDPTVPAWAKASTKPTYTAAEVGALPDTTVIPDAPGTLNTNNSTAQTVSSSESLSGTIKLHKISKTGNYNDLLNKPTIPAVDIALTNSEIDTIWNNVMN